MRVESPAAISRSSVYPDGMSVESQMLPLGTGAPDFALPDVVTGGGPTVALRIPAR